MRTRLSFCASLACLGFLSPELVSAQDLDGHWISDGYGFYAKKQGDRLELKEIISVSCTAGMNTKHSGDYDGRAKYIDASRHGVGGGPATLLVSADGNKMRVTFVGAISDVIFYRTASAPKVCNAPTPNTPQSVYKVFWANYAEHYPFFGLKNTDWSAVDKKTQPLITHKTKPKALFNI